MSRFVVLVAALLAAGGLVVGAAADEVATVERAAVRVEPPRPAVLVSDSAWLGLKIYGAIDGVQGFDHVLDLASCRRRVVTSCRNYNGFVPITLYDELEVYGDNYHTLIVATGYNDSDLHFASEVDAIVRRTRDLGYDRIVWLTLRANVSYTSPDDSGFDEVFRNNNETLRELVATGAYPEIVIADWATYAHDEPGWFASDGIHVRGEGPWAAADYISRKLAFLDGRPCPQPAAAGQDIPNPCPDPDATGPVVDIRSLYPVGVPNPTAEFMLEFAGHGSWPDAPWWER